MRLNGAPNRPQMGSVFNQRPRHMNNQGPGFFRPTFHNGPMPPRNTFHNRPPPSHFSNRPPLRQNFQNGPPPPIQNFQNGQPQDFQNGPPPPIQNFPNGQPHDFQNGPPSRQNFPNGPPPPIQNFPNGQPKDFQNGPPSRQNFPNGPPPPIQNFSNGQPHDFQNGPPSSQSFPNGPPPAIQNFQKDQPKGQNFVNKPPPSPGFTGRPSTNPNVSNGRLPHPNFFNGPPPRQNFVNRPLTPMQELDQANIFSSVGNSGSDTFPFSQPPPGFQIHQPPFGKNSGGSRGNHVGHGPGAGSRGHGVGFRGRGGMNLSRQQQQNGGGSAKKKKKVNTRELAENNVYFCDTCDRGFKTEEKYQEHVDGHQKCSYKDCPFIAAPKLVQLHQTMQHRNGLAKKIYSLESEEDIAKWREQRKKNFPTTENIEKKKKLQEERLARGEVIETKDFSKMGKGKGRGRFENRGRGRGRGRGGRGRWRDFDSHETENTDDSDDNEAPQEVKITRPQTDINQDNVACETVKDVKCATTNDRITTAPLDGNSEDLAEANHHIDSASQDETNSNQERTKAIEESPNTSLSLLAGYGDSSDSEDSEEKGISVARKKDTSDKEKDSCQDQEIAEEKSSSMTSALPCEGDGTMKKMSELATEEDKSPGDSTAAPCPELASDSNPRKRKANSRSQSKQNKKKAKGANPPQGKRKYTLLEKLLAPDIRKERNIILQCVHFIVKKNFFDDKKSAPSSQHQPRGLDWLREQTLL